MGLINHPAQPIKELIHMSATRVRDLRVAVDDTGTLHYGSSTLTGTVVDVVRFTSGPRRGRVRKIAVTPVTVPDVRCYFVPDRTTDRWLSVGGATTLTF